jgi:hypothetical protein
LFHEPLIKCSCLGQGSTWGAARSHTHTHARARTHTHTHSPSHIHACIHPHTFSCTSTHMHTHIHIHTCAHSRTKTCAHPPRCPRWGALLEQEVGVLAPGADPQALSLYAWALPTIG